MNMEKPRKDDGKMNRRSFLAAASAAGLALVGAIDIGKRERVAGEEEQRQAQLANELRARDAKDAEITFLRQEKHPLPYNTSRIEGMRFGPPLADYFGTTEKLGKQTNIDFKYQLAELWKQKLSILQAKGKAPSPYLLQTVERMFREYAPAHDGHMSLEGYGREIDRAIQHVNNSLDWKAVRSNFDFDDARNRLFEAWARLVDTEVLTAISMAELLPAGNGERNTLILEALLETGGSEFLSRVPSCGDALISMGQYQFTKAVVFDDGTRDRLGGASYLNRFTKDVATRMNLLPNTVLSLRGNQHHEAAYLNALNNIARLIKSLSPDRVQKFSLHGGVLADGVRAYIIGAHHRPLDARGSFGRYAGAYLDARTHGGRYPHFQTFAEKHIKEYVQKGTTNLAALRGKM